MNKDISAFRLLSLLLVILVIITSCQKKKKVPFPENASGYKVPVAKPFTMPEAKAFEWKAIDPSLVPKAITIPLDFDKLPYKDFSVNAFKPLPKPIETRPLNWESLEEIQINLDTLKGQPFTKKTSLLPEPSITKVVAPTKWEGSTSGILRMAQTEGLIGSYIYAMVTDSYGGIWISTDRGLTKYVGEEFKTYDIVKRDQETNGYEFISDLQIGNDGKLIFTGYQSGLYILDIPTGVLEHFEIGRAYARVRQDHEGVIWLSNFDKGLHFIKPGIDTVYKVNIPLEGINNNRALGIHEDNTNNMWFGFVNNLIVFNPDRTSFKVIKTNGLIEVNDFQTANRLTEDSRGNVWLSTISDGAIAISIEDDQIKIIDDEQGFEGGAKAVIEDDLGRIWIIDNNYLTVYDPKSNQIKKIPTNTPFREGGWPSAAMKDDNGMIWVGSQTFGVLIVDPFGPLAGHFNKGDGLVDDNIWGLFEDNKERIWISTYAGINIYDQKSERLYYLKDLEKYTINNFREITDIGDSRLLISGFGAFSIVDLENKKITVYQTSQQLTNLYFHGIRDEEGNFWFTSVNGIFKFNLTNNTWQQYDRENGLHANTIYRLIVDSEGVIWATLDDGITVIDPVNNTNIFISNKDGFDNDFYAGVIQSKTGEMLIISDKGLDILNNSKTEVTKVGAAHGMNPEILYDIIEINGKIRLGSENGHIIVDRPVNGDSIWHFTNYGKREGFPYNDYNQMTSLYTKRGLTWNAATPSLSILTQDPIENSKIPSVSITGINIMDQHPTFKDNRIFKELLTDVDTVWNGDETEFQLKNGLLEDTSYLATHAITWDSIKSENNMPIGLKLPYNENFLSFNFINSTIRGRDEIVYRYVLEGSDEAWSEISSTSNSKNYYNLSPGQYTFKVASRGFSGQWSEPTTFSFMILPPWWQTWWAYGLFIIIFGSMVFAIVQFRSQWLKRENRILEERVSHRTAQLKKSIDELKTTQSQLIQSEKVASLGELTAGIAHEIQNPLNFVNNFSEVNTELIDELEDELAKGNLEEVKLLAKDIKENEQKINHHGKRADGIVKGMLQHSRNSNGIKEPTDINVLADEYLRLAYHGLRAKDKSFNAKFETDFDETIGKINVVSQDMGRVILNLITNAFYSVAEKQKSQAVSGYEPTVKVTTKKVGDKVEIRVKDNGNGIPKSALDKIYQPFFTTKPTGQGTGLGLSMSYDIVTKSHDGELKVETKENEGTEFIIIL